MLCSALLYSTVGPGRGSSDPMKHVGSGGALACLCLHCTAQTSSCLVYRGSTIRYVACWKQTNGQGTDRAVSCVLHLLLSLCLSV